MKAVAAASLKVADEVWVATALLHREQPERVDFTVAEIVERAERENIVGRLRPGVYVHASRHAVANLPPSPNTYRMLVATAPDRRRLYRPGDPTDAKRTASKAVPRRDELPEKYRPLLDWYAREYAGPTSHRQRHKTDPLLRLIGLGKEIWKDEPADDYIRRLREEWD